MAEVFGLPVDDLPEGWQPLESITIVKCIRPDGEGMPYTLCSRWSDGLTPWEAAGMADWVRGDALNQITPAAGD